MRHALPYLWIYAGIKDFLFFNYDMYLTGGFCVFASPYIRLLNNRAYYLRGSSGRELRSRKILRSINYKPDKYICKLYALSQRYMVWRQQAPTIKRAIFLSYSFLVFLFNSLLRIQDLDNNFMKFLPITSIKIYIIKGTTLRIFT